MPLEANVHFSSKFRAKLNVLALHRFRSVVTKKEESQEGLTPSALD